MGTAAEKRRGTDLSAMMGKIRAALFYAALTIEILVVLIDKSELVNPYESYIFRVTFALTVLVILLSERTWKEWVLLAAAVCVGLISYRVTGRNEILRIVLFVATCRDQSREKMLKTAFWETFTGCLVIFGLAVTGVFGNMTLTMLYRIDVGEETRYTLGFGHPNALHTMAFMLVVLGILSYHTRLRLLHYLCLFLLNAGLYLLTDSRTGTGITAAAILLAALIAVQEKRAPAERAWRRKKWPYIAGSVILLFCIGFSVWAASMSYNLWIIDANRIRWQRFLDEKLTGRITDLYWGGSDHADLPTWKLFSEPGAVRYFDMGWCRLFYWYGIVPALLTAAALLWLIYRCRKTADIASLWMVVILCIYTVVEAHLVSVYIGRNYLLLILGAAFAAAAAEGGGNRYGLPRLILREGAG